MGKWMGLLLVLALFTLGMFSISGASPVAVLESKSKEETMVHMAIEESFEGTLLRPLPINKPPHRALCWINGPPISACLHQEIIESISSRLSPSVNGKQGKINISINTMNQKMLEIHLMLSSKQGIA